VGLIEQGIRAGQHLGAQVYASLRGKPAVNLAVGEAAPGVAMTPETLMLWMSATKPIVAAAVMQCVERGELALDDPIARHLPPFAAEGKDAITIRHLLTHTGGFRHVPLRFPEHSWPQIIDTICAAPIEKGWEPGKTAGYHPRPSWFILGELVQRATDQPLPEYLREKLFEPLGMADCFVGIPENIYEQYHDAKRIGMLPNTEGKQLAAHPRTSKPWLIACAPASNGLGPTRQLARFYEMLLNGGTLNGARVLQPDTVEQMTHRQRAGAYDLTFQHRLDWGLGMMLDKPDRRGRMPYGHGRHASPGTFGHGGMQSSAAFGDPHHGLAVAAVFVGMPGEQIHQRRMDELLTALYEELKLANP
jgi:CubicO group peptidase (beta-lactamase class C family)